MLTTYSEILLEVAELKDELHPEDRLHEIADSLVPIYYSDIIEEWRECPMEYSNTWQDSYIPNESTSITQLMQIDLYNYYYAEASYALTELQDKWEED